MSIQEVFFSEIETHKYTEHEYVIKLGMRITMNVNVEIKDLVGKLKTGGTETQCIKSVH